MPYRDRLHFRLRELKRLNSHDSRRCTGMPMNAPECTRECAGMPMNAPGCARQMHVSACDRTRVPVTARDAYDRSECPRAPVNAISAHEYL